MGKEIKIGLVGHGYWGNIFLNSVLRHGKHDITWICDPRKKNEMKIPHFHFINDCPLEEVDLVFVATPPGIHFEITKHFMERGANCLVTKPVVSNEVEFRELANLASISKCNLFADHTFISSPSFEFILNKIKNSNFGKILNYNSNRSGLGIVQKEVSVVKDLVIHDLSILDALGVRIPKSVVSYSQNIFVDEPSQIVNLLLEYDGNFRANISASWLSGIKVRNVQVGFENGTILWDDLKDLDTVMSVEIEHIVQPEIGHKITKVNKFDKPEIDAINNQLNKIEIALNSFDSKDDLDHILRITKVVEFVEISLLHPGETIYFEN